MSHAVPGCESPEQPPEQAETPTPVPPQASSNTHRPRPPLRPVEAETPPPSLDTPKPDMEAVTKEIERIVEDRVSQLQSGDATRRDADKQEIAALVQQHVSMQEAAVEQRVKEHLQEELQKRDGRPGDGKSSTLAPAATATTTTTPPAARTQAAKPALSSTQIVGATPQNKAVWTASSYNSCSIRGGDSATQGPPRAPLTHRTLEDDLTERVLAAQPDRQSLGYTEVVVRDLVSSVVREIVGIVESLLDRLLQDRKHDTIRSMVADLVTEDISATMATGYEQLKLKEFGHIMDELKRLHDEAAARDRSWEERFQVTQELRDSQDDLWATLDKRYREMTERLDKVETGFTPKVTLDAKMHDVNDEFNALRKRLTEREEQAAQHGKALGDHKAYSNATFASKDLLSNSIADVTGEVNDSKAELLDGLRDLRKYAAAEARVKQLQEKHENQLRTLQTDIIQAKQEIDAVGTQLTKASAYNEDTYATKFQQQNHVNRLTEASDGLERSLAAAVNRLTATETATRALEDANVESDSRCNQIEQKLERTSSGLHETSVKLKSFECHADANLATREYAREVADNAAKQMAITCDEKEEIAQLRREFEDDRELLRQNVRVQQHTTRKDLNFTIEEVHDIRLKSSQLEKQCAQVAQHLQSLDDRETQHWEVGQTIASKSRQGQEDLENLYRNLREEFVTHREFSKGEAEKLRHHSTQCYLEQMDKALGLHTSLEKIEHGHKELNETVRSIKLPKVTNTPYH